MDQLVCAYRIDPEGKGTSLDWEQIRRTGENEPQSYRWVHLHHESEMEQDWLRKESGLEPVVQDALLASETRPRCTPHGEGAILNLRGVNLNPGEDIEDMVSIRMWVEKDRIISVRLRKLMAVQDMRELIEGGHAPKTSGDFVSALAFRLTDRMEPEIVLLSEKLDELEDDMLHGDVLHLRRGIAEMRRRAAILRRFVAPQREALARLGGGEFAFISNANRIQLREAADRVTRMVEELDSVRERAAVVHDQLTDKRAEEMNKHMLVLSVGAAIFLPLTFLTGLLGMNVGGLPWSQDPLGFAIVIALCVAMGGGMLYLFRRMGWL